MSAASGQVAELERQLRTLRWANTAAIVVAVVALVVGAVGFSRASSAEADSSEVAPDLALASSTIDEIQDRVEPMTTELEALVETVATTDAASAEQLATLQEALATIDIRLAGLEASPPPVR